MTGHQGIKITPSSAALSAEERQLLIASPGFGQTFTDHMFVAHWGRERGWHDAQIGARAPFMLDPACAVLHYAQEIFEGLKAYRTKTNGIALFRPEQNARRFAASATRMAMPTVPEELFIDAISTLVTTDRGWLPDGEGSLYIRPFMFASESFLGVRPAEAYIFAVIASPVGAYFKGGARPITVWLSEESSRAAPGGTGAAKCGGNYAASLLAQATGSQNGCDQVMFLDAVEHRWIEELGGMNLFFVMDDDSLITPPLDGTILPGITRDSVITLARDRGLKVREVRYGIDQLRADAASGRLSEAFACGTAAVVAGIGQIKSTAGDSPIGSGKTGPLTAALGDELVGLQRSEKPDPRGWRLELR